MKRTFGITWFAAKQFSQEWMLADFRRFLGAMHLMALVMRRPTGLFVKSNISWPCIMGLHVRGPYRKDNRFVP
jgi:hypothetical protein